MRAPVLVLIFALGMGGWLISGCRGNGQKTGGETAKTYDCPACKDKVSWMYNSKGLPTGFKTVEHTCPSCKRAWWTNLSTTNTCSECARVEKLCPTCLAKRG